MRTLVLTSAVAVLALAACDRSAPAATQATAAAADTAVAATAGWPASGAVNVQRDRRFDLTGDGREERIVVTASGERYDSLDIVLAIEDARGAPLWVDRWTSRNYFEYETAQGRSEEDVAQTVRTHVDALLDGSRFHGRGMPPGMVREDPSELLRESVRYHLAELDWRRGASLEASDPTPQEAQRRIRPEQIGDERVEVVLRELRERPTYNYFTGGEASYVLGWSEREQSFVRLFACC